jgi:hypothetical protein
MNIIFKSLKRKQIFWLSYYNTSLDYGLRKSSILEHEYKLDASYKVCRQILWAAHC